MKQQYIFYFFMALPLLVVNSIKAANVVGGDGPIGLVIKGDNNYFYQSPYSVVAGFSNSIVDGHGGYSDSSDASKVVGSNNSFRTGKNNAVLGDGNTLTGSTSSNASHLVGNNNQASYTKQSNVLGSGNSITGTTTVIGNNNVVDGSIIIGNSIEMIEGATINIGNGLTVLSDQQVSFNNYLVSGIANALVETDAINVGQLNQSMQQTLNSANNYTDTTFDTAKGVANDYTDQRVYELLNDNTLDYATDYANTRFNQLDKKIKRNQRILNAGIASAMATASIPAKLNTPFSFGIGAGHHRSESALAVGFKWGVSKNLALGSAIAFNTRSDTSYSLQVAYGF